MKKIIKSMTGILILILLQNENAGAMCGIGGIFGTPPIPTCACQSNKVAIIRISGNVCQEERCVSQGAAQHYLNQGWTNGCCSSSRMGTQVQQEESSFSSYPNPASSLITTTFLLNNEQKVIIQLIDVNGRIATTLADKYFGAGKNKVEWNTSNLNEGIYFLQIRSDDFLKMEKLIVSK